MSTGFAPLAACPACGKQAGELIEDKTSRFPFRVKCGACGWMTDAVKLEAVAVKLWSPRVGLRDRKLGPQKRR